jgi:hypothetical protein
MNRHLVHLLFFASILSGCSANKVLYTPRDFCESPHAKGMARIVVTRHLQFFGGGQPMLIKDMNQPIGKMKSDNRLCWDRYPGLAVVSADEDLRATKSQLSFEAKADMTYELEAYYETGGPVLEMADKKSE